MGTADRVRYRLSILRHWSSNRLFIRTNPGFSPPPADLLYETSSNVSNLYYSRSGEKWARRIWEQIDKCIPYGDVSVCEWGCGLGRVIRHMATVSNGRVNRSTGMDYDRRMVDWCSTSIPGVEFYTNNLMPPTRFESNTFDALYCYSVFTHLSESAHFAWVDEVSRIVRPGGVFIFTTMGDACRSNLLPGERAKYDAGELVVRSDIREGSRIYAAYGNRAFVADKLLAGRKVLSHVAAPPGVIGQDLWVVRT